MKKFLLVLLALLLCLTNAVLAEGDPDMVGAFEDGCYVIRIPVADGDEGWVASDMSQDDSVVVLNSAEIVDGVFTATYAPVGDGTISVAVKHMDGIACDQIHTFDLKVEGDAIENVGGSYTASPAEEEQDPYLSGEWQVNEETMAGIFIEKNEDKGWSLELAMAYPEVVVLKASLAYDCELDAFVYADGTYYKTEIGDDPEAELGEVLNEGASGSVRFVTTEDGELRLEWYDSVMPDATAVFWRMEE